MSSHESYLDFDDAADRESEFCACGVTLLGDPGEGDGLCITCGAQPHPGRDSDGYPSCGCDECEAYWARVVSESEVAAATFNRRLVCSCGWTGAFPEQHR